MTVNEVYLAELGRVHALMDGALSLLMEADFEYTEPLRERLLVAELNQLMGYNKRLVACLESHLKFREIYFSGFPSWD
ncbi:MAG: hypothetical protein FWF59_12745 [Turicibacter sp.]|nr:hypothetical protein [Turicibacter sp.]